MRIHVTGGAGFLGRHIVPLLRGRHQVDASDRAQMDVTNYEAVCDTLRAARPEIVIHLAALCGAQPSRESPVEFYQVNTQGAVNVLEACRRVGVPRFILASSMTVFGAGDEAMTEESPFAPRHPYAVTKVAAELALRNYGRCFGIAGHILRPTLVVGEGYKEPHAVGDFVETGLSGRDITLFGDGSHRRDFIHPEDVARAFAASVERLATLPPGAVESFNFSTGEAPSMVELAELVISLAGHGRRVLGPRSEQSFSLYTRIDRARELLGWQPRIRTADIVTRLLTHHQKASAA
jgi:nucleoside-diphosphate-sugar epimerase